ncbi:MAG TPA: phenylacetate--CoA ligase family protein [Phycisphaerae bacterium]|nr:phenylacetate--CoA ligase family protein [Phycisphaerae bacterium]
MLPILARTIFRIQERLLGRRTFTFLKTLEESQWWPRERVEALQLRRLRDLVSSAYEHTPYWRAVMDERGIRPDAVESLDDLKRFPLLEKPTLRARREEMAWRDEGPRVMLVRTSGSTNEALQFYTSSNREAEINAARIRNHRWVGVNKGDKEVFFWGSPVELDTQGRIKQVRDWLINEPLTNGFELTPDRVVRAFEDWKRWRPKCVFGYPSTFVLMADMARKAGIDLKEIRRRGAEVIVTTSEMLGDVNRKIIREAFDLPVYDSYGLREAGLVSHECDRETMHTNDEHLILETVDPQTLEATGGEGELVVTSLISRVMPVIRYRTGDIVTLSDEPCPCGRRLNRIAISGGRAVEFVVTNQGKWVVGYSFIYICRSVPGIVKFQVRQDRLGQVRVVLATDEQFPADGVEQVTAKVRARLGSDDEIVVEQVADIKPAPSGKYRPVVSKVAEELRQSGRLDPSGSA